MADEGDGGWRLRATRTLFESRWFALRQDDLTLPGGEHITYTRIDHPGWAMIVPLLPDGQVVMERVFRHPHQRTQLECPSGGLDGDDPETAARRELEEETGYRAGTLSHLGHFAATSGISNEEYDLFLATDLRPDGRIQREATEQIEVELISLAELRAMALRGAIRDGPSTLAILLASERVGSG